MFQRILQISIKSIKYRAISTTNFDVVLIAAGVYGFPLAYKTKEMGKVSIELCSGLHPLLGIKNKTQQIIRKVSRMYRKSWIFPLENPPARYMEIEHSAYWE